MFWLPVLCFYLESVFYLIESCDQSRKRLDRALWVREGLMAAEEAKRESAHGSIKANTVFYFIYFAIIVFLYLFEAMM